MSVIKSIIALSIAAGFAGASFAQPAATPATATAAKVVAPAAATAEKKIEAPKAAEPAKAEVAKSAAPAKVEVAKTEAPKADEAKPAEKHSKAKGHSKKEQKPAVKAEGLPVAPAPASK